MKKKWLYWFIPLFLVFLFLHQILSLVSTYFGKCKVEYYYGATDHKLMVKCQGLTESIMKNVLHASAFTLGRNIFTYNESLPTNTIVHELGHVYQYEKLGPLFLPAYGVAQLIAVIDSKINNYPNVHAGNFFEIWANKIENLYPEDKYLGLPITFPSPNLSIDPTPSIDSSINKSEEWQLFETKELKMSFKYPSDWETKRYNDGIYPYIKTTSPNSGIIQFWFNPPNQGIGGAKKISEEKIILDGLTVDKNTFMEVFDEKCYVCGQAKYTSCDIQNPHMLVAIEIAKNKNYYLIGAGWESKTESNFEYYFDKIIASFKFLD